MVNASMIREIVGNSPNEKIILLADESHIERALVLINNAELDQRISGIGTRPTPDSTNFWASARQGLKAMAFIRRIGHQNVGTRLFILTGQTSDLLTISLLKLFGLFPVGTFILWHSLINTLNRIDLRQAISFLLPVAFFLSRWTNVIHMVMNPAAKNLLQSRFRFREHSVVFIDHPMLETAQRFTNRAPNPVGDSTSIIFATIGKGNPRRINSIVSKLESRESPPKNIEIWSIGGENRRVRRQSALIRTFGENKQLPRSEMEYLSAKVHYFIFPYPSDAHRLSASGAFIDAIYFEKPCIFLKNDYIDSYYGRFQFGIRCNTVEEMVSAMLQAPHPKSTRYRELLRELHLFKAYLLDHNHLRSFLASD